MDASMHMRIRNQEGIALVLTLFLMLAMSVIAASFMFLSQTETYASMNYRLMSQARYGGESGVSKATNYLLNTYVPPATGENHRAFQRSGCVMLVVSSSVCPNAEYLYPPRLAPPLARSPRTFPARSTS